MIIQFQDMSGRKDLGGASISPAASGATQYMGADLNQLATRAPSLHETWLNSRSQEGEFFLDPREFGACVLFFLVVTAPAIIVCAAVVLYATIIA